MKEFKCTIYGKPTGQDRPIPFVNPKTGRVIRQFHDTQSNSYEVRQLIKQEARRAVIGGFKFIPKGIPVEFWIKLFFKIPASRARELVDGQLCAQYVDMDNTVKMVKDACKGIIYHDDRQIARYPNKDEKLFTVGEERIEFMFRRAIDNAKLQL